MTDTALGHEMTDQQIQKFSHEVTDSSAQQLRHRSARNSTSGSSTVTAADEDLPPLEQTYTQALAEAGRIASNAHKDPKDDGESVFSSFQEDPDRDPFDPFPIEPHLPEEKNVLTFRAVFIGCLLGALVNASNVYLGMLVSYVR